MKPLIIYHAGCTDGFGAAYAAWLKFGDEAEYYPANYTEESWKGLFTDYPNGGSMFDNREVYVLDFSFSLTQTRILMQSALKTVWLDHHKTAFENWCGDDYLTKHRTQYIQDGKQVYVLLDNNRSGAMLAWEHFHPDTPIPDFIKFIDDRDRWQWKYENSAPLHAALSAHRPWMFRQWQALGLNEFDDGVQSLVDKGIVLLKAQDAQVQSIVKYAMKCTVYDHNFVHATERIDKGLAVNTNVHMSEIGNELANQSGTYGLVWYLGTDGTAKVSLRSNGDYDVSAIAKQFAGGGHKNAAGFTVPITTLLSWLK